MSSASGVDSSAAPVAAGFGPALAVVVADALGAAPGEGLASQAGAEVSSASSAQELTAAILCMDAVLHEMTRAAEH